MNSSLVVQLGYGEWVYPYLYQHDGMRKPSGFLAELWKTIAPNSVYTQYPYENGEGLPCDSLLREIYDGRILTAADSSSLTILRESAFRSSLPVYYTSFVVAEAERTLEEHSLSLTFFTVFTIPVFLLVISLLIVSGFIEKLVAFEKFKGNDNLKFLCSFLISIGFAFVFFFYTASFNGNAIIAFQARPTTLDELLVALISGKRSIVFSNHDQLSDFERESLFGNISYSESIEPDMMKLLQSICDDKTRATIVEAPSLQLTQLLLRPCNLQIVTLPEKVPQSFREIASVYLFSRETSRKVSDKINQALLRIFTRERVESFWTQRYIRSLKFTQVDSLNDVAFDYIPMSLFRLQIILIVAGSGLLLSIIALIIEIICFYRFHIKRFTNQSAYEV